MRFLTASLALALSAPVSAEADCEPASAEESIALASEFYAAFNAHDGSGLDEVVAENWVDVPPPPGQDPGLSHKNGMQAAFENTDRLFNDFYTKNEEFIVSGNKVVVRSTATGIHSGEFLGLAPTGKSFSMTVIDIHTACGGRITRSEHVEDWLSVLLQLGALPIAKE